VKFSRDPADVRGGEPLGAAMNVHFLPAHGAALRRAAAGGGPEGTQEHAVLADGIDRNLHTLALSVPTAS
jgi:hypothetical protein